MLPQPVKPNMRHKTQHFKRDRAERRQDIKSHNQTMGNPMYSFIVDTGNHLGQEIHTITDKAMIIIQGVNDARIITSYAARPKQITRYWDSLRMPYPTDSVFPYILKFAQLNIDRKLHMSH